jgi:hypothetical protein
VTSRTELARAAVTSEVLEWERALPVSQDVLVVTVTA